MTMAARASGGLFLLVLSLQGACHPGKTGELVRPPPPKVQESLCDSVADFGQPLVVDLKAHERAVYETVMNDGVAVVSYDCSRLHLLKDCKIAGDYGFVGVSPKEEVVRLEGADEIQLNLPSFGAKIAAEVRRDASLDLGLILVGMRRTTVNAAERKRLEGSGCEDATHFVRGAFVGAFALKQGSSGTTRGAVEILGSGGSAKSTSSKRTENRDGDAAACKGFNPTSTSPDPHCAALLRLELTALEVAPKDEAGSVDVCPRDLVLVGGKCAPPGGERAFQCREGQLPECLAQCEKGHAGSCAAASFMYFGNHGVSADPEKAAGFAEKACASGSARGCGNLGHAYDRGESLPKDMNRARELYSKSCEAGWPRGCSNLGVLTEGDGDATAANGLYSRACSGGEARACHFLALNVDRGKGTAPDPKRAKELFTRACNGQHEDACGLLSSQLLDGTESDRARGLEGLEKSCAKGSGAACRYLGTLRLSGSKLQRDPPKAAGDFERACESRELASCGDAARLYWAGRDGVPRDATKAAKLAKKACDGGQAGGCRLVAVGHLQGAAGARDDAGALKLLEKTCADADGESCAGAGLLHRHGFGTSPNPAFAVGFFDKACKARYAYGCALLATAHFDGAGVTKNISAARVAVTRACSLGYSAACGAARARPLLYEVTPTEDAFGKKTTRESARAPDPFGNKGTAAGAARPSGTASSGEPDGRNPELEARRQELQKKLKQRLGALRGCPRDRKAVNLLRVFLRVERDGKLSVRRILGGRDDRWRECTQKRLEGVRIKAGSHVVDGVATLVFTERGAATMSLAIQPDESELTLPPTVRRLAGCACDGDTAPVCAIECRSGSGSTGGPAGPGGPEGGYGNDKHTEAAEPEH
jgi:TPR repeat protein